MFDSAEDFAAWFGAPLEALKDGGGSRKDGEGRGHSGALSSTGAS